MHHTSTTPTPPTHLIPSSGAAGRLRGARRVHHGSLLRRPRRRVPLGRAFLHRAARPRRPGRLHAREGAARADAAGIHRTHLTSPTLPYPDLSPHTSLSPHLTRAAHLTHTHGKVYTPLHTQAYVVHLESIMRTVITYMSARRAIYISARRAIHKCSIYKCSIYVCPPCPNMAGARLLRRIWSRGQVSDHHRRRRRLSLACVFDPSSPRLTPPHHALPLLTAPLTRKP